jgi:diguanylate cyclase (GGDEF)-like protein
VIGEKQLHGDDAQALAYQAFGELFPVALVLLDASLEVTWASPGSEPLLGFRPEMLVGRSIFDMVHPDDLESAASIAEGVLARADETLVSPAASTLVEFPVRVLTSTDTWERCTVSGRLLGSDGTMLGMIRSDKEVHALDAVIAGLGSGGDLESVLLAAVDLARAQFKVERAWVIHDANGPIEAVGRDCSGVLRGAWERLARFRDTLSCAVVVENGIWSLPVLSETGETLFAVLELPAQRPEGPAPLDMHLLARVANLVSIAFARHRNDRLLTEAATIDFLTGVANRRHFESRLAESALAPEGLPFTLLYVDLDDFKAVNDNYGHHAGDQVLAAVAGQLSRTVRPGDFVGRLGGDEFAVGALGLSAHQADGLVQRVRDAVEKPISVDGTTVRVTVSIGVAGAADEDALETILERGDDDMFNRKRTRPQSAVPAVSTGEQRSAHPTA